MSAKPRQIMVIAPHADDEILACGGTLLRHMADGDCVHWVLVTKGFIQQGFSPESLATKEAEIAAVLKAMPYKSVTRMDFPAVALDTVPRANLVQAFHEVLNSKAIEILFLPFGGDVHSDHSIVFETAWAASKSFRTPTLKQVYCYETLSETGFQAPGMDDQFAPDTFVDISQTLAGKMDVMAHYASELGRGSFPRSLELIKAQAALRGSIVGLEAAEAFMCLRRVV